jgi:CRP-like cAMP-binding protein
MPASESSPERVRGAAASNRLLDALPRADRRQVLAAGNLVHLETGAVLYSPEQALVAAYFPVRGFISLTLPLDGHAGVEVGLIGTEGMFGVPIALGADHAPVRAIVRGAGSAIALDAVAFRLQLADNRALCRAIDRYAAVQLSQLAQATACTRFHAIEARLARWLLTTHDRAGEQSVIVTHELLGIMLGVRRAGITIAAGSLQRRGLIRYHRGTLTVVDRRRLKTASCGCYEADKAIYERLLGRVR